MSVFYHFVGLALKGLKILKESLLGMSRSSLFHSVIEERKKNSEKVTPGFDIGNIIDLIALNRIKLHPIWN